jgi:UDP-N-acetylmuramyl pentapeptide phosphotransferase/UDP-N-acetylglucosamine-1-phosphate transferase
MINFFILVSLINLIFLFFFNPISIFYNQFDHPDFKRKLQKKPISLLGGFLIIANIFLIIFFDKFFFNILDYELFNNLFNFFIFLLLVLTFFLLGFLDDKFKISANKKLFLTISFLSILFYFDRTLLIKELSFSFFSKNIFLGNYSYFFTILCFLLFINAFNMLDGINGQAGTYGLFLLFIFLTKNILPLFVIGMIICLIIFLLLNFNNKTFLGDSGSLTLGFLFSYLFVKSYAVNKFYADEIFLIMCVPGFDLLRLAITRLYKKKHPFKADSFHMHHLILKKLKFFKTFILIQTLLFSPYLIYKFFNNFLFAFLFILFVYSLLIVKFNQKIKNE